MNIFEHIFLCIYIYIYTQNQLLAYSMEEWVWRGAGVCSITVDTSKQISKDYAPTMC